MTLQGAFHFCKVDIVCQTCTIRQSMLDTAETAEKTVETYRNSADHAVKIYCPVLSVKNAFYMRES